MCRPDDFPPYDPSSDPPEDQLHAFTAAIETDSRCDRCRLKEYEHPQPPRIVCAWCQFEMSPGAEPASHGICPSCLAQQDEEGQEL